MNTFPLPALFSALMLLCLVACSDGGGEGASKASTVDSIEVAVEPAMTQADSIPELTGTMADTVVAGMYLDRAEILIDSARYDDALGLCQKALEIYRETVGEMDTLTAKGYKIESEIYRRARKLDASIHAAQKALAIGQEVLGSPNLIVASSNISLGLAWAHKGNYDQALTCYSKSLEIFLNLLGEEHTRVATLYNNIGLVWDGKGNYDQALAYYKKSLEIYQNTIGEDHPKVADTYNNLGVAWYSEDNCDSALVYFEKALEIRLITQGSKHQRVAYHYNNIGLVWEKKGNYDKALKMKLQILGNDHLSVASTYNNLGGLWYLKGNYDKALAHFEKSLEIYLKSLGKEHEMVGTIYINMGAVWHGKRNKDQAMLYYQKALDVISKKLGMEHLYVANTYNNMGAVLEEEGKYDQALEYYKKSLEIYLNTFGKEHSYVADTYISIGIVFAAKGNYDQALAYYKKSLEIYYEIRGKKHPRIAGIFNNMGVAWREKRFFDKAASFHKKAAETLQYNFDSSTSFSEVTAINSLQSAFYSLSKCFKKKHEESHDNRYLDNLKSHYQIILALEDYIQKEYSSSSTRQFYAAQAIPVYEGAIANLLTRNLPEELPETFTLAEKTKSRLLAEEIQSIDYTITFGISDSLREKEHDLNVDITYYEKKKFQEEYETETPNDSLVSEYKDKIFNLRNQRDQLLETFKTQYPEYYNLRYSQKVITIQGVQDSLLQSKNGAPKALVEYFAGDSSIYAFTILPDTFYIHDIKRDFPLEQWVQDMRCGIFSGFVQDTTLCGAMDATAAREQYAANAHRLYQKLFAPVDSLLPEEAEIIVVPDGVLGYLPFDALLVKAPKAGQTANNYHYLLRDHTISYAYSATLQQQMQYRRHQREPSKNLLAFAPTYGEEATTTGDTAMLANRYIDVSNRRNWLTPLKYNIPEVETIGEIVGGDLVIGEAATEEAFTSQAGDYRILHLSTHGKANDQVGDYSFLAFYQLDDSLENEWLYNRELYNLRLNADMVVLSACETGIGELQRGEGIISLARGFSYAGAKSIVTSLWSVNDQSTKVLMELFYQNLKAGMDKDKALRLAKLDYLDNHPNLGQEPYYWAAFIPIGDMSAIGLAGGGQMVWWALGVVVLLGVGVWLYWRSR